MKNILSIEFENEGKILPYKIGETISFISFKGIFKCGMTEDIVYIKETDIPCAYIVYCEGARFTAKAGYVIKRNSKVLGVASYLSEIENEFPLST